MCIYWEKSLILLLEHKIEGWFIYIEVKIFNKIVINKINKSNQIIIHVSYTYINCNYKKTQHFHYSSVDKLKRSESSDQFVVKFVN